MNNCSSVNLYENNALRNWDFVVNFTPLPHAVFLRKIHWAYDIQEYVYTELLHLCMNSIWHF